jgi:hypothetical protein
MIKKRIFKILRSIVLGLLLLAVILVAASAISNINLPTHSQVTERLSDVEKARLSEVFHLRTTLGDAAWPGWGQQQIPIIVYNEEYAFLVGYPNPPDGWRKMPQNEWRGGPWEAVPDDTFEGEVYYRQPLDDPEKTPENFTVLVGERWVATMGTLEYGEISFYNQFPDELPPNIRPIVPYRLVWKLIMGNTETYIGGLEHESFHAFQGSQALSRLAAAEYVSPMEKQYPWGDAVMQESWQNELDLLLQAVRAPSDTECKDLARQFLAARDQRREDSGLSQEMVNYERQREWLEGLAKYNEITIVRLAGSFPGYVPLATLSIDPGFKHYSGSEKYWSTQIDEVKRLSGREGETRFYYSGMAQAVILDRLMPGWKEQAFQPDVMLEDLLRQAVE